jgi:hypothetical protein
MTVEQLGVPTVPIVTSRFEDVVKGVANVKGMPHLRTAFVHHPVFGQRAPEVRKFLQGNDPITGQPLMDEIVAGLTKPLTEEERKVGFLQRPMARFIEPDTPDNLQRIFLENGWTDYLPIVLPTEEKVAEMLKGTRRKPDEIVGTMRPSPPHEAWEYTVEKVAVNAVMAGARPEYFPVILAIAATGATSLFTSTNSWARMMVVNGPIRNEIKMNPGIGAMGPFNQANATLGRAWTLISKNLGNGGKPGINYMGSQGNNFNYNNVCFPEKEEALPPGWKPLHVQKGFKPEESVVSVFAGIHFQQASAPTNPLKRRPYESPEHMSSVLRGWGSVGPYLNLQATVLVEPLLAQTLYTTYGFDSKEKLVNWLRDNTLMPAWEYFRIYPSDLEKGKAGVEPYASWLKFPEGAVVPVPKYRFLKKPEVPARVHKDPITLIVMGGETNPWYYAGDFYYVESASVDKWR